MIPTITQDWLFDRREIDSATGCWNWTRSKNSQHYGVDTRGGKTRIISRESYKLFVGPIPEKMLVCHRCDNPKCFNPEHLFLGTHKDNQHDMILKGRQGLRALNRARLTEHQVGLMRSLYETGQYTQRELARIFSVSFQNVSKIVNLIRWRVVS